MTNVVALVKRRKRVSAPPERPCEILFFTGVRYMRQDEAPKRKGVKATRPAKKRRA